MDSDDRPRPPGDLASQLVKESLDHLSVDELGVRIRLLEEEIARIVAHRARAQSHRAAADALFGGPALGGPASASPGGRTA
jgi:uncharacterized small protein (DUF1192 family)